MTQPKFFITHSHQDNAFARKLYDDLRGYGLEGFFDIDSIEAGDDFAHLINQGLETCDVYVPILSHAALKSKWCLSEISAAITLNNEPGRKGKPRIIPVLIENCQDSLPPLLRSRYYINFTEHYSDGLQDLLENGFKILPQNRLTLESEKELVLSTKDLPNTENNTDEDFLMHSLHPLLIKDNHRQSKENLCLNAGNFGSP